jgi:hypothetical protein
MKHTEYIVPIGEEAQDYDEMFIGVIRRQPELVRCKDCKYFVDEEDQSYCIEMYGQCSGNGFCAWAERKE